MTAAYFITGTDTDIGKTWVALALLRYFAAQGFKVAALKPVASGCVWQAGQLVNPDALLLQQHASMPLSYQQVNPYAFALPVSPHLACADTVVEQRLILSALADLQKQADKVVVEGAGGWLSPLSKTFANADLAKAMAIPVIMVVGIRLGCINQARLTLQAIRHTGARCAGWVAVELLPGRMDYQSNVDYLIQCLSVPLLAEMPYLESMDLDYLAGQFVVGL